MVSAPDWLRLEPGEEVVWTGHPRIRRVLGRVGSGAVWAVAAIIAAVFLTRFVEDGPPPVLVWAGAVVVVALAVASVGWYYVQTKNVGYVMTTDNVYKKTGVFSERVTTVGLEKVQNLELTQGVTGNLFDYGSVAISTAGSEGVELTIDDLDDPGEFRSDLRERVGAVSARDGREDRPGRTRPDAETLEELVAEAREMRESAERIRRQLS